jgi:hypothetical protein
VELLKGHASGNEDPSPVVREQRASPLNNAGRLDNE